MIPTLAPTITLEALYAAIFFTLIRLRLDPRLQPFAPTFEAILMKWWEVYRKERSLLDNQATTRAQIASINADLGASSDGVAGSFRIEAKKRRPPQLERYFGAQQPYRFRRSALGPKLALMRTWPPSLKESASPVLKAYGERIEAQVAAADKAVEAGSLAEQELLDFRVLGDRQRLINEVNGLRKELHGDVSKLIHAHPEWNLGRAYVNALFEHETAPPELSDDDIDKRVDSLNAEVAKLIALRQERAKDAEAEKLKRERAEKQQKRAVIEAAEKEAAQASAKLAAIKAQIGPID